MKIGIFTEYFFPTLGGITENIYHFSRELLRHGHDFRIVTGFRGMPTSIDEEVKKRMLFIGRNIPIFFNGSCGRITMGMNLSKKTDEVLARERFDIISTHSPVFPTLPFIAVTRANAPVVGTFHTCTDNRIYYALYRKKVNELLARMAGRIAVSKCCALENESQFDAKFDVIPNGVDVDFWRNAEPFERFRDGKINILFLGRPDTRNGLDVLIAAFAKVHKKFRDTRLIVVGDGPLLFHFKSLVPRDCADAVAFEGAASILRPRYAASADIFCFTPTIASFGITILEGMSAGRAMIASDIEAFRALLAHGKSAILVPPTCESALAAALERFIANKDLREKFGQKAFQNAAMYDWKNVALKQIEYYNAVLKK